MTLNWILRHPDFRRWLRIFWTFCGLHNGWRLFSLKIADCEAGSTRITQEMLYWCLCERDFFTTAPTDKNFQVWMELEIYEKTLSVGRVLVQSNVLRHKWCEAGNVRQSRPSLFIIYSRTDSVELLEFLIFLTLQFVFVFSKVVWICEIKVHSTETSISHRR